MRSPGAKRAGSRNAASPRLRCAIYTRVSTDQGLEQDFNSLDAQFEACAAYIKSQQHEGWGAIRERYDDGGFSGGSLERPALQQMLADIALRSIDIVVVYKVDRLTRSLADFAKLVELFDGHSVSFVSVTQSFNTTSSMGRLTLNVLLSFAQFEREVTGERIRDKIAASKQKDIWVGGVVPLGYRVDNRKLVIDAVEAETVRFIFRRYRELRSMTRLLAELNRLGIRTRQRTFATGRVIGGIPFGKGALCHLLKNRVYVGELNHKGRSFKGEHEAIIDLDEFELVQATLRNNAASPPHRRTGSGALLVGLIYDDSGNRMTPVHTNKNGARYRYYVSRALAEGRADVAGSVPRVPAPEVEQLVLDALADLRIADGHRDIAGTEVPGSDPGDAIAAADRDADVVADLVSRVVITKNEVVIELVENNEGGSASRQIRQPWSKPSSRPRRTILEIEEDDAGPSQPIRADVRTNILGALAKSRRWLQELSSDPSASIESIAAREDRSPRSVGMVLSLSFLAPSIVQAIIDGTLPRGIGLTRLTDLPMDWAEQHRLLGLATGDG